MCLGLGNGCVVKEEKRTSLLKPYTKFDRFKDMTLDELAEELASIEAHTACIYSSEVDYSYLKSERKKQWLEELESEAE